MADLLNPSPNQTYGEAPMRLAEVMNALRRLTPAERQQIRNQLAARPLVAVGANGTPFEGNPVVAEGQRRGPPAGMRYNAARAAAGAGNEAYVANSSSYRGGRKGTTAKRRTQRQRKTRSKKRKTPSKN